MAVKDGTPFCHLKVMKLVYISHGFSMAIAGKLLVKDEYAIALEYGPIYQSIWDTFKSSGTGPILKPSRRIRPLDPEVSAIVTRVYESYGGFTPQRLSAITHKDGTPWSDMNKSYGGCIPEYGPAVSNESIKNYYTELLSNLGKTKTRRRVYDMATRQAI